MPHFQLPKPAMLPDPTLPLAMSMSLTPTSNTTSCSGAINPSYIAYTNFFSDANYETRFTHAIGSNFAINTNCYVINTLNIHNSTNARKINNLSEPTLEIGSSLLFLILFMVALPLLLLKLTILQLLKI